MGISFPIPKTWAPGRFEGTFQQGTVRIDDLEQERITLMWQQAAKAEVDEFVKTHLQQVEKQAKKKKIPFESSRNLRSLPHGGEMFRWKSDLEAVNLCLKEPTDSSRVIFLRLLERPGETLDTYVDQLCKTIKVDQGDPDLHWSVFGLELQLPRASIPKSSVFNTGRVALVFESNKERLDIEKQGPANVIMQGLSLFDWVQKLKRPLLQEYRFTGESKTIQSHAGAHFWGKRAKRKFGAFKAFDLWCWECEQENKLHIVFHQYKKSATFEFDLDKIRCHPHGEQQPGHSVDLLETTETEIPDILESSGKSKKSVSRRQMLLSIPVRNEAVEWEQVDDQVQITHPFRFRAGAGILARMLGMTKGKTIWLDQMGAYVWKSADGEVSIKELVDMLAREYKLEQSEAYAALMAFLRSMMKRKLLGLQVPRNTELESASELTGCSSNAQTGAVKTVREN